MSAILFFIFLNMLKINPAESIRCYIGGELEAGGEQFYGMKHCLTNYFCFKYVCGDEYLKGCTQESVCHEDFNDKNIKCTCHSCSGDLCNSAVSTFTKIKLEVKHFTIFTLILGGKICNARNPLNSSILKST
uniref:Uncharacterized protein n=1 Tax=Meloidogyne enterolobii TaxID=390850 RepID=A0A6V7V2J3_MELEN|nr:unnamed protein product [Meloidogyne enterolobii]